MGTPAVTHVFAPPYCGTKPRSKGNDCACVSLAAGEMLQNKINTHMQKRYLWFRLLLLHSKWGSNNRFGIILLR